MRTEELEEMTMNEAEKEPEDKTEAKKLEDKKE